MDWRLELVAIPVSDVDRAKAFYTEKVGFTLDHDITGRDEIRFLQLTPPGSGCSITLGTGISDTPPDPPGLQLVVSDIQAAHAELAARGVEVSDVQEFPWGSFVFFSDPDGNRWAVQQLPTRRRATDGKEATMDMKLELVLIPVLSGSGEGLLRREGGFQPRRRSPGGDEFRVVQIAAGLGVLDHGRNRDHRCGAGLLPRHAPGRHGHRGGAC